MEKEQILATQIEAIIKQVQLIERFGAHEAMLEACETIAGVMAEQGELFALAEHSNEKELKDWARETAEKGRIYSAHLFAIRDALRLCNLVNELVGQMNAFLEDGGRELIEQLQNPQPKDEEKD